VKRFMVVVMATLVLSATSVVVASGAAFGNTSCPGTFVGTIDHGGDAGLSVQGHLVMSIADDGAVSGVLARDGGSTVLITGQRLGRSIHVVFDLGASSLRGVGSLVGADFTTCMGTTGGVFQGPGRGDGGHWGIIWGS
jgi:hypothetical protein